MTSKLISEKVLDLVNIGDVLQVDRLTFPAKAGVTAGDYVNVIAKDGTKYAVQLDKTGTDPAPTGAMWLAADYSVACDISAVTTAIQVAAAVEVSLNSLTDFTAKITTDDTSADGKMLLTQVVAGVASVPVPKNADDSAAGSITTAHITDGFDQPNVASSALDIRYCYGYAMQNVWASSTASASVKLQDSCDGVNWSDVDTGSQAILNNNGTTTINKDARYASWVRAYVTYVSGMVTSLSVVLNAKG